jgi:hypothetical protein
MREFPPRGILRAAKISGHGNDRLDLKLIRDEQSSDGNGQRDSSAEPILMNDRPIATAVPA